MPNGFRYAFIGCDEVMALKHEDGTTRSYQRLEDVGKVADCENEFGRYSIEQFAQFE